MDPKNHMGTEGGPSWLRHDCAPHNSPIEVASGQNESALFAFCAEKRLPSSTKVIVPGISYT